MAKIHDWEWMYWTNKDGERTLSNFEEERDVSSAVLAIHQNGRGDEVSLEYAPDDVDGKYVVKLNGEIVTGIVLDGENFDEEEFEELVFATRAEAREASADLRRMMPAFEAEDVEEMEWEELLEYGSVYGLNQNDGREAIEEALV